MARRSTFQVNEMFRSIQGEGMLVGRPASFIRLQGCMVGCHWCDTKYTWLKGGKRLQTQEILDWVISGPNHHVIITGGEPTMYNLDSLIEPLQRQGYFVQLETSGQQWLKGQVVPDWITWSPKQALGWRAPIEYYCNSSEVKWVVDEPLTLETIYEAEQISEQFGMEIPQVLMPEGCPPRPEMVAKVLEWLDNPEHQHWMYGDRIQYRIGVR